MIMNWTIRVTRVTFYRSSGSHPQAKLSGCDPDTIRLVIFVDLIFRDLWSSDDFMGLFFRGISSHYIAKIQ